MIYGRYLFTNIAFLIQVCQPQEQNTFVSTANEALAGTLMTIGDVNDIFPSAMGKNLRMQRSRKEQ